MAMTSSKDLRKDAAIRKLLEAPMDNIRDNNEVFSVDISSKENIKVYPKSINQVNDNLVFLARMGAHKYLYIISPKGENTVLEKFQGRIVGNTVFDARTAVKRCLQDHHNAVVIRELLDFTRPVLIGIENSMGFGDRLGLANPGHVRAVMGTGFRPVLAQQSIRELERTEREPEEVMDAATWAVFQEGYKDGFGADADHLKTTKHIDRMVRAGFTMFTFDPSSYILNEADSVPLRELLKRAKSLPWALLHDTFENLASRYENRLFTVTGDFTIRPSREVLLRALIKYGAVIAHTVKMYRYLRDAYPDYVFELELSIDETKSVTTPFEHFFVVNELKRLGITVVGLAPRFIGDFEKGIDYKGDLNQFREEYIKHVMIAELLGPYKISIHSGSDKFSVYGAIGSLNLGHVHVKTAGTSYLEALRTIAATDTELFREILDFAREQYETEKASYHVSADLQKVPSGKCSDEQLIELFDQKDARQVLHVTFGKVLTCKDEQRRYVFRERLLNCLRENEDLHYDFILRHFRRHIDSFIG